MSDYIHMRHGFDNERAEIMELLNKSFGFSTEEKKFEHLIPKLYNEEYKPAENNVILEVNGEKRAAVGLYYNTLTVCGEKLKIGGIGNVAVLPEYRNMGYMRFCMAYCLDEMKQNMTDFSFLCGNRQRYAYYSYEPAGLRYKFGLTENNLKKKFGNDVKCRYSVSKIQKSDKDILTEITHICKNRDYNAERNEENIYDIFLTWHGVPFAVTDNEKFIGWFVFNSEMNRIYEAGYKNSDDIGEIMKCIISVSPNKSAEISAPPFDTELCKYLSLNGEYYSMGNPEQYSIFCFEKVIKAFLKLKSTYENLQDGSCIILIEGEKLPEQLKITVKDNNVTVEESYEKPDIALTHDEAMRLVGSIYSERRNELKPECASWFPLPLYTYESDSV